VVARQPDAVLYLYCPDGSHMAMYDDQKAYFVGLTDFLLDLGK
jgi:proline iminopeptidase